MDEVTPFQVVFAVAKIRERFLLLVQESLIDTFSFRHPRLSQRQ
ncbi:MAG: hypothetical protein ACKN9W_09100 [Methylococcus sp.]